LRPERARLERTLQSSRAMPHAIVDGLSLVDATGRIILATTILCLLVAIGANLWVRTRYASLKRDLGQRSRQPSHPLLTRIIEDTLAVARRGGPPNTQALIEEGFQAELRTVLLAERFVKAATGLVIILGLLGTFYGLTLSIGRIVQLVGADGGGGADVAGAVTTGLTHALSGMAVAFSNSLLGIVSAVILTVLNVISNPTDQRTGLMLELETYLDRLLASAGTGIHSNDVELRQSVARLDEVVARFEAALGTFAASTSGFQEFNRHLKDNIQRMSLSFGDFSDTLKGQLGAIKARDGR
jgi:hypothetical protein